MQINNYIDTVNYNRQTTLKDKLYHSELPFKITVSSVGLGEENPETGEKIYASYNPKDTENGDYVYTRRETKDGRIIEKMLNIKDLSENGSGIQKLAYRAYNEYKRSQNIHNNQKSEDFNNYINKKFEELKSSLAERMIYCEYSKMKQSMNFF